MSAGPLVTYVGVVHPWMCDTMGHMNVRHYAAMFDDASFQLLGHLTGAEPDDGTGPGWADVRCEIDYKHETRAGTLVTINSRVTRIGNSSLTYAHRLLGTLDGALHAQAQVTSVRFDLQARQSIAIDDAARLRASELLASDG